MRRIFIAFVLVLGGVLWASANRPGQLRSTGAGDTLRYLFVGHPYNWQPGYSRVDPKVVGLDLDRFDMIILGGDVNSEALKYERFVQFMDSVFDLRSQNTMYVIGNHDARNENFEWYEKYTGRKTWNAHAANGAVYINMNTTLNPRDCEELDGQYEMIKHICDTITAATSHLFLFQHHNTWVGIPGLPHGFYYSNWQIPYWNTNCSSDSSSYAVTIYPMLKNVQARGVKVIQVLGDAGAASKAKEMYSTDSLVFLATGINNSKYVHDSALYAQQEPDKVLIFEHVLSERKVTWRFHNLDSLFAAHQ